MTQYQIQLHPKANTFLTDLNSSERDRVTDVLQEVAGTRQPSSHGKVELLETQRDCKAYRVRVGGLRAICELDKPEFRILRICRREQAYRNVDDIYAAL